MKKRVRRRWLLSAAAAMYIYAGYLGERQVRDYARWMLGPAEAMSSAQVETRHQGYLYWWRGEWRDVRARGEAIHLPDGLQVERMTLEFPRLRTWPWQRMPIVAEDIRLSADFRAAGIKAALQERTRDFRLSKLDFSIDPNAARLQAGLRLMGREYRLNLRGQLGLGGRAQVVFMPSAADVQAASLPAPVVELVGQLFNPLVDLEVYPLEIHLENYRQGTDELTVTGRATARSMDTEEEADPRP